MTPFKDRQPIDCGVEAGVHWATVQAPLWGAVNGYVRLPDSHPWRKMPEDDIGADVHGGLTYHSEDWVGFDTLHSGDVRPESPAAFVDSTDPWARHWTPEMVAEEAKRLARQVAGVMVQ